MKKITISLIALMLSASVQQSFGALPLKEKEETSTNSKPAPEKRNRRTVRPVEKTETVELTLNTTNLNPNTKLETESNFNLQQEKQSIKGKTKAAGKSQLVALLLAIFVGALGIHRFYLGYTTIGIIQLLTLGGLGIWTLIDIIRIATGDLKPKGSDYSETLD